MISMFGTITPPPMKERGEDLAERMFIHAYFRNGIDIVAARWCWGDEIKMLRKVLQENGITEKPMGEVVFEGWMNTYPDESCTLFTDKEKALGYIGIGRTKRVRVYEVPEAQS